jgi:hypothetical protein
VRLAEDIDFKYPMKKACKSEMELFCKNIEHGHARVISCLQEKQVGHPEPCAEMQRSVIKALRWNTTPPLLAFSPFDSALDNTHSHFAMADAAPGGQGDVHRVPRRGEARRNP